MINNLKDLRAVLKLCREYGVSDLNLGSISLRLGEMPIKESSLAGEDLNEGQYDNFPKEMMSPERLQYYAMGGTPEADPFKEEKK